METPHVRYLTLAVLGVDLAPFTMCLSIPVALFVGPIIDRLAYAKLTGAMPRDLPIWKVVSMTFITAVPLIIASFVAFFTVCAPAGGLVFMIGEPVRIAPPGDPPYGLMALLGAIILVASTYLGLMLPFHNWRSRGRFERGRAQAPKEDEQ